MTHSRDLSRSHSGSSSQSHSRSRSRSRSRESRSDTEGSEHSLHEIEASILDEMARTLASRLSQKELQFIGGATAAKTGDDADTETEAQTGPTTAPTTTTEPTEPTTAPEPTTSTTSTAAAATTLPTLPLPPLSSIPPTTSTAPTSHPTNLDHMFFPGEIKYVVEARRVYHGTPPNPQSYLKSYEDSQVNARTVRRRPINRSRSPSPVSRTQHRRQNPSKSRVGDRNNRDDRDRDARHKDTKGSRREPRDRERDHSKERSHDDKSRIHYRKRIRRHYSEPNNADITSEIPPGSSQILEPVDLDSQSNLATSLAGGGALDAFANNMPIPPPEMTNDYMLNGRAEIDNVIRECSAKINKAQCLANSYRFMNYMVTIFVTLASAVSGVLAAVSKDYNIPIAVLTGTITVITIVYKLFELDQRGVHYKTMSVRLRSISRSIQESLFYLETDEEMIHYANSIRREIDELDFHQFKLSYGGSGLKQDGDGGNGGGEAQPANADRLEFEDRIRNRDSEELESESSPSPSPEGDEIV